MLKNSKILLLCFALFCISSTQLKAQTLPPSSYNYGEVIQKSMFFYEAQRSGPLPADNRVHWRGDSGLNDGSDVGVDLTGGWHDAGDKVKFGFPMAFSATILAWSGIVDQTAYESIDQWEYLQDNLRWVNDYFIKCHIRNADGSTQRFYGQVGNGTLDHNFWGPAEIMQMARPAYYVDTNNPGSELTAETAAAMAAASMIFASSDPAYSAELLDHAIALYDFADTYRGKYSDAITDATAFYNSWSGYNDEIVWGAIWLYRATGDMTYLNKAIAEYPNLGAAGNYTWTLAWDDKSFGSYVLMAELTGQNQYMQDAERWLDYWTDGYNGQRITYSPGGQAHLDTWGSLRYASNTAFAALIYSEYIETSNPTKSQTYRDFGITQINYALGDNPNNRSYVVGFGNNPPMNPHHDTAHGSWSDNINEPAQNRHILYGALVGGPGTANDQYVDDRSDYIANEVACDYNAGFTGAVARLVNLYGGTPLADFPQPETYDVCEEYFNEAKLNSSGSTFTEVAIYSTNRSAWPAMMTDAICYRYFFDISEGIAAGYTINDYTTTLNFAPSGSTVSAFQLFENTTYFVEVCLGNEMVYPGGQSAHHAETQLRIALPNDAPAGAWDASNDYSFMTASGGTLTNSWESTIHIPFYNDGVLLCGVMPDGSGANALPMADVTVTPTSGNAPITISFDASNSTDADGDVLTYMWDFGDGNTSTDAMGTYTYSTPGVYTLTLTIDDGNGGTVTETMTITAIDATPQPPTAIIVTDIDNGASPLTVMFDGSNSSDVNADALTYMWDFGDGNTSTDMIVNHTYMAVGSYTATLMVSDGTFTDVATITIDVVNLAPTAAFTASQVFGPPPLMVDFDGTGSSDPNGDNLTYAWDFGDGNTATTATASNTFQNEGVYTVTLTVMDSYGESSTYSSTVNVSLTSCQLTLAYRLPEVAPNNNSVRAHFKIFNQSSDPVNLSEITLRYWYTKEGTTDQNMWVDYAVVGSGNVTTSYAAMASPVSDADHYVEMGFTAGAGTLAGGDDSGEFQLRFSNTDWSNLNDSNDYSYNESYTSYTAWENVTLYCNGNLAWGVEPSGGTTPTNMPPTISFSNPADNATVNTGNITFTVDAADSDGTVASVVFDVNGTSVTATNVGGNTYEINYNAATAGSYTITATATDDDGATSSDMININVVDNNTNTPPTISFTNPANNASLNTGNATLQVNASDSDGNITSVVFDVNGTSVTANNMGNDIYEINYNFTTAGNYTITATATDDDGDTSMATINITVIDNNTNTPPTISFISPMDGETLETGFIVFQVEATDTGGSITDVVFNVNGTDITATSLGGNIYEILFDASTAGTYTIMATANDNEGATSSETITINVAANMPPMVSFVSPMDGETLNTGSITFTVEATDNDGSIASVFFNINGNDIAATNVGGNMYELTLNAGTAGTYTISATATDDDGDTSSETITITVTDNVLTCDVPTNAQESVSGNSVTLTWDDMDAIEYQIAGRRAGGNWILITPNIANSRSFTLAANSYQWTVRSLCSFEWTGWAPVRSFTVTGKNAAAQHGFEGETIEALQLSAFPNPTSDVLNIVAENPLENGVNVEIYNILGEKVWSQKSENATQNTFKVSVADLPKGLYFVKINNGLETAVEPFTTF